jgi:hypothetical protein
MRDNSLRLLVRVISLLVILIVLWALGFLWPGANIVN